MPICEQNHCPIANRVSTSCFKHRKDLFRCEVCSRRAVRLAWRFKDCLCRYSEWDNFRRSYHGSYPPLVVRGAFGVQAPARPAYCLPLRLRLAASALAVVFLLVLAHPFHIGRSPVAKLDPTVPDYLWWTKLSTYKPSLKSHSANSY